MSNQITDADLKAMSPHEIVKAQEEGRLDALLGRPVRDIPTEGQLTGDHLAQMTPTEIVQAQQAGRLDQLLGEHDDAA